ncbi:hypothetical protein ONE63_009104 [Megalurothrips usitatus]|uniref:SUMO-activating enzyme subunit n=1 Tax=Megalurothrips usitatus TaxID=439358 RepID=A0AAV7XR32_9NEOP|nr:hypothetical protein ONE63_009104 [Megalurothrips usitatus]KAJ1525916.1 hypothetical protein ONE63_009104 [Megalurothrips usitatus]
MAASIAGVFSDDLKNAVEGSKILVVGAGGIGCEILKNLVLSGFKEIEIIDLDTIDVSNLNRQFLFQKQHVGKAKAVVARESALSFNPDVNIVAHHDSIIKPEYSVNYFKQFKMVLNALDNRAARNHVNRMCLAADIPLIESGTAGYDGQVELIKKGMTKCYECEPKAAQKTFPGCTIRNTPSEPIHCIVWGKHLFNQLFGEYDADNDVSPDTEDPEAAGSAGETALTSKANDQGDVERVTTRQWAQQSGYDSSKIFHKLFHDDIEYLLSMHNLWEKRRKPTPLKMDELPDAVAGSSKDNAAEGLKDQRPWSIVECAQIFSRSLQNLKTKFEELQSKNKDDHLVWDKDDKDAMDFVAACANIRAHIFGIPQKTRFDIKSMAGNIIPAIATTNAIIAGLVVLNAFNILRNQLENCHSVYCRLKPNHRGQLIVPERGLNPPNEKCYVCRDSPQITVCVDVNVLTVKELEERVLKSLLNMVQPDAVKDSTGDVVISSEEGEMEGTYHKTLAEMGILDGTVLSVDDFVQNYSLQVIVNHRKAEHNKPDIEIVGDQSKCHAKEEGEKSNGESALNKEEDEDDLMLLDETPTTPAADRKRKPESVEESPAAKKLRSCNVGDGDIIIL